MRPYKAYFPRKDAYARRICRLLVFTASMSVPKRCSKRYPLLFFFIEFLVPLMSDEYSYSSLQATSKYLSSLVAHKTSLLFVTLHVSITLYEVCRVFLSSRWLTIHHTPGRIRTHTAQILSLLSPAVGLLEQNHHRGSRTPSFWFVAKCFIH